ncbi:uncharacterized protein LOC144904731 [Branchiostoma floridae x Branchiostoma belcheri]
MVPRLHSFCKNLGTAGASQQSGEGGVPGSLYSPSRGERIVPCRARCKTSKGAYHNHLHYHCHMCHATIIRKCDYVSHILKVHKISQQPTYKSDREEPPQQQPASSKQGRKVLKNQTKTIRCNICNKQLQSCSLRAHMKAKHTKSAGPQPMTKDRHHKCVCIDSNNGIYLVKKQLSGAMYACHVAKKTTGHVKISCSVQECQQAMGCASRSRMPGYECPHLEPTKKEQAGTFLTAEQAGTFLTAEQAGTFLTAEQAGTFLTAEQAGTFLTAEQAGTFLTAEQAGTFLTAEQAGTFLTAEQAGTFLTAEQAGTFLTAEQAGKCHTRL